MDTFRSDGCAEMSRNVYHGGDIATAQALFPDAPAPWLDLSTGINPNPYPLPEIAPEAWRRLPSRDRLSALEEVAAAAYGVSADLRVAAGPGAQAIIQTLPRLRRVEKIGILGFTYLEYQRVWRSAGAFVQVVDTLDELLAFDIAVIVNPNNPDGRLVGAGPLAELAGEMARRGKLLVVDEAFIDPLPDVASACGFSSDSLIVLRSFGKMYGLAGIRLGFAIASPSIASAISQSLGPWAVSGPAIEIGARALCDRAWLGAAIADLNSRTIRMDSMLARHGLAVVGGTPLFRLVAHQNARAAFDALGRRGILVRHFPAKPELLRFGTPGTDDAFDRLEAALGLYGSSRAYTQVK
jgi:cobalamin biosynthesis protein CobC